MLGYSSSYDRCCRFVDPSNDSKLHTTVPELEKRLNEGLAMQLQMQGRRAAVLDRIHGDRVRSLASGRLEHYIRDVECSADASL